MYSTLNRFLKYVTYDTQSVDRAEQTPSTPGQLVLAEVLGKELESLGLMDVEVTPHAYVTATCPSNIKDANKKNKVPAIGFVAHIDTATEVTGKDVKPSVVTNYDGGDITLKDGDESERVVLSPKDFPYLLNYRGQDIVVTDGNTLLGADNKAGVAEIIAGTEWLIQHPEIEHGDVKIAFTPDEEVGHLAKLLDIEKWGADFAYTLDGGAVGEICWENFNAASAVIDIKGRAVHPGKSKGLMLNAVTMGQEFNALFPPSETPATTEGYEGYYHCLSFNGSVEGVTLKYIIRDHDTQKFEERKKFMEKAVKWMQDKYGSDRFVIDMRDQYRNMADKVKGHEEIVELALSAMRELGIEPNIVPMRGGTDGAALSWRGLVTPNIFTGGHNYHGKFEFISVQSMDKAVDMMLKILELAVKK
ncbi:peptidase T [Synergistales bacterium]|nr:peptidase T [Synergistales bacterium]